MKNRFSLILMAVLICFSIKGQMIEFAEPVNHPESCTSIMVGKKATIDGSVITSHTCDGNYRTWMTVEPAQQFEKDTLVDIVTGRMHTVFAGDQTKVQSKGMIPQAKSVYKYLNTAYPCLNEKQLGIGETTITGRKELVNKEAMFMIEELQMIVLQRCTTARDAIRLIGELVAEYGYADAGECLTIADPKEVWHFEIFGEGPGKKGGVWAAVRIPDDHVGVSANIPRISSLNLKDTNNYIASPNVFDVAKKLGYWDGKEPFCFWKAYGGGKKAFNIREYFILNYLAPSLNLSFEAEELPLTVKPEKKVGVTDVMALLRQTYEGTEWDMTKNLKVAQKRPDSEETDTIISPSANPWMTMDMVNMLNGIQDSIVVRYRLVSVPQCSYSHVIQLRDWLPDAVGGIAWMSFDNPGQSPRFPVFAGLSRLPECFTICGQHRYREDAAIWTYRRANKLATVRWGLAREDMNKAILHFEEKGQSELPFVESRYQHLLTTEGETRAQEFLTGYTADFVGATLLRWKELGDQYWKMFARGF